MTPVVGLGGSSWSNGVSQPSPFHNTLKTMVEYRAFKQYLDLFRCCLVGYWITLNQNYRSGRRRRNSSTSFFLEALHMWIGCDVPEMSFHISYWWLHSPIIWKQIETTNQGFMMIHVLHFSSFLRALQETHSIHLANILVCIETTRLTVFVLRN